MKQYIEQNKDRFLEELFSLIRIPSISSEQEHKPDMVRCAERWKELLLEAGADKVSIIRAIDRQVDLEQIAKTKNLTLDELLDEIYSIVDSGTKLNIDYYIREVMDDDHMQDIYDYFREAEDNNIDDALDEFAEDEDEYTEEEIKLVRIKFLSENGN